MQVGAFTTEEKCLKKYVGTQWSDMFQMWKNNQAAACKGALNALNDVVADSHKDTREKMKESIKRLMKATQNAAYAKTTMQAAGIAFVRD